MLLLLIKFIREKVNDYIPIEQMAQLDEVNLSSLKTLQYKSTKGNDVRFKNINGKLYIHLNYKAMLKEEMEDLYYKAIVVAKNDNNLAIELAKITGKKKDTIQRYLIRFTFKQISIAKDILEAMKTYIQRNSLLPFEELCYEC